MCASNCGELSWYLSYFFPFQRLTLAHSLDKSDRLDDVNAGLFSHVDGSRYFALYEEL
jgi:hypothetical protein